MALNGDTRFIGEYSAWYVWSLGIVALFVGSALFGVATWRARALSRAAALALAVGAVFVIPLIGGLEFLGFLPEELAPAITVVAVLAFAGGWAGLGVSALRVGTASRARLEGAAS